MIRIVVMLILLMAVPFVVYAMWEILRRGPDGRGARNWREWEQKAVLRLGFVGLLLSALGLAAVLATQGTEGTGVYQPARIENGKLIDGGFNSGDATPERSPSAAE